MADLLQAAVRGRISFVISGGTGTGKTTLLNALSNYIPEEERLITIEDAAELQLQQLHVGRMETRPPNAEGKGEIRQRDLVKNALRMRPDRIIIGECRGEEAFDMLQAMNTGQSAVEKRPSTCCRR
jgi:pilus assembly protein CpaF